MPVTSRSMAPVPWTSPRGLPIYNDYVFPFRHSGCVHHPSSVSQWSSRASHVIYSPLSELCKLSLSLSSHSHIPSYLRRLLYSQTSVMSHYFILSHLFFSLSLSPRFSSFYPRFPSHLMLSILFYMWFGSNPWTPRVTTDWLGASDWLVPGIG